MKTKRVLLLAMTVVSALGLLHAAGGDEDFLRAATEADQGFDDLGGKVKNIVHEWSLSNVFSAEELARGQHLHAEVKDIHDHDMQAILRALEKGLADEKLRTGALRTAGDGHRKVADSLSRMALLLAPSAENVAMQALLEKLRVLAANVAPLAHQVEGGQTLKADQKTAADNYGDQAHGIAKEIEAEKKFAEASQRVDKAGTELTAKDPVSARADLETAIRLMTELLEKNSDSLAHAKEVAQDLKAMAEDLKKAEKTAEDLAKTKDANKAADQAMDAMVKESELKDKLQAMNQNAASNAVAQAMDKMQAAKYDDAAKNLKNAVQAVEKTEQALEKQIARASQEQTNEFKKMQDLTDQLQKIEGLQKKLDDIKAEQAAATQPQPSATDQQPQSPQQPQSSPTDQQPQSPQQPQSSPTDQQPQSPQQPQPSPTDQQPPSPQQPTSMSPAEQQKLENEMKQLVQEMKEGGQPEASQDMKQAEQNTEKGENHEAEQNMEKAEHALAEAHHEAEQSLAQEEHKTEAGQHLADTQELSKMQQALSQIQQQKDPSSKEAQQQMQQMQQEMQQAALPQAAQDMQQAQQQAQQHNPEAAQKSMQQAQQELAQAQQQAQQAQQAMNHEPPDPNAPPSNEPPDPNAPPDPNKPPSNKAPPEMKVEDRNKGTEVGAAKPRQVENTWRAGLPDRERQALLTARKESYAPEMESDVKRYYELLAE